MNSSKLTDIYDIYSEKRYPIIHARKRALLFRANKNGRLPVCAPSAVSVIKPYRAVIPRREASGRTNPVRVRPQSPSPSRSHRPA